MQTSFLWAQQVTTSTTVTISATVGGGGGTDPGTGGGGGGGGGGFSSPTAVNFSGMGYPLSKVVILKDNEIALSTIAGPDAKFSASISNLTTGTYTFSLYTEDKEGRHSLTFSFPLYITSGSTINVGGIILSPTIDVDKIQVKRGENLTIFGYGVPNSEISITVNSDTEHIVKAFSDIAGGYLYNFNSGVLNYGEHSAHSRAVSPLTVSGSSIPAPFRVGTVTIQKGEQGCGSLYGDLNCDGRVNLVDFSILSYWYRRSAPPVSVDLNGDGTITLIDFSILAYHWTG